MSTGVIIAKPDLSVDKKGAKLYVDPKTPLLKVYKLIRGALDWDGTTAKWIGDYIGTAPSPGSFELHIPHNLGYVPTFLAYMDTRNNRDRKYINSSAAGVGLAGDISASAIATDKEIALLIFGANFDPPLPGLYGYAIYLFYDEVGASV